MNYMRISKQKFKNKWFKHITQKESASFQQVTTKITVLKQLTFEKIEKSSGNNTQQKIKIMSFLKQMWKSRSTFERTKTTRLLILSKGWQVIQYICNTVMWQVIK